MPTYEKIDRVLMDTKWELKFSLVTVCMLVRLESLSDHAPAILDSMSANSSAAHRPFKFKLRWLQRDGFADLVRNVRDRPVVGQTPVQRWNSKIRAS